MSFRWVVRFRCALAAVVLAGIGCSQSVSGAEIRSIDMADEGTGRVVRTMLLSGQIVNGDNDKLLQEIKGHFVKSIVLASPGGNVQEAMQISTTLNRYFIEAYPAAFTHEHNSTIDQDYVSKFCSSSDPKLEIWNVVQASDCECVSACALIALTAPFREMTQHYTSLGLHRPYFDPSQFAKLDEGEARVAYRDLLKEVEEFLAENDVPQSMIETMMSANSTEVHYLSYQEWLQFGWAKPFLEELLISRCDAFAPIYVTEGNLRSELAAIPSVASPERDKALFRFLSFVSSKEYQRAWNCIVEEKEKIQLKAQGLP